MAFEIVWTKRAIVGYERIINYLDETLLRKRSFISFRLPISFLRRSKNILNYFGKLRGKKACSSRADKSTYYSDLSYKNSKEAD